VTKSISLSVDQFPRLGNADQVTRANAANRRAEVLKHRETEDERLSFRSAQPELLKTASRFGQLQAESCLQTADSTKTFELGRKCINPVAIV
jgi:hypothetical protein